MKKTSLVLTVILSVSNAFAGKLSNRAQGIADRLQSIEGQLNSQEKRAIRQSLHLIESLIGVSADEGAEVACVTNGQSGPWEKFKITNLETGATLGGETTKATCEKLLQNVNNGLVCLSNGQSGPWEAFTATNLMTNKAEGGQTKLETCLKITSRSSASLICRSNGQSGPWENFQLYNRKTETNIGGANSNLDACLSMIR